MFRYLPATLSAKDGRMINTLINSNLMNSSLRLESGSSAPDAVNTTKIPRIPNVMEDMIKTRVATLCILQVYQNFISLCYEVLFIWFAAGCRRFVYCKTIGREPIASFTGC